MKQLITAVPINNENVKTINIIAETSEKEQPIMELNYNSAGDLTDMKIKEAFFGTAMSVQYQYENGYLFEEIVTKENDKSSNRFYYSNDKMIIENSKGLLDVYTLDGRLMVKNTYIDGELILSDRIIRNCRLTNYQRKPINKICFSDLNFKLPLIIEKYTNNENEAGRLELQIDEILSIDQTSDYEYDIKVNQELRYKLKLNQDSRLSEFSYIGNKENKTKPVNYKFNYILYRK